MKKNAKNPAQAGDAVLAFYYAENCEKFGRITYSRKTTVHTNERPNFHSNDHHGKDFALKFWGPSKGIVNITLPPKGNLFDAILAMNFSKDDMEKFSHIIMKSQAVNIGGHYKSRTTFLGVPIENREWDEIGGSEKFEIIDIYRLDDLTQSLILAKIEY